MPCFAGVLVSMMNYIIFFIELPIWTYFEDDESNTKSVVVRESQMINTAKTHFNKLMFYCVTREIK